jgi:SAM-dependent methyltransferase
MRRVVSAREIRIRQLALRSFVPFVFGATNELVKRAESRMRRTAALQRHIKGRGLEIGAAASPSMMPLGCHVTYVDKYPLETLSADPELAGLDIVRPEILASAEHLEGVAAASQDFVLAFSMIEHAQSPLHMVESLCRVTRPGGSIVLSVPDKDHYTPDHRRPLTSFEHLVRDYEEGPEWSYEEHLYESGRLNHELEGEALEAFVAKIKSQDGHTHFHVWNAETFLDFIVRAKAYLKLPVSLKEYASYGHETLIVWHVHH